MATVTRVTRIRNPRRKVRRRSKARRRLTAKQIRFFGSRRQKAALKSARRRKLTSAKRRRVVTKASRRRLNPRRRAVRRSNRRRATRRNPALVLTLGAVNPKRRKHVAVKRRRKRNRRTYARRRNPVRRVARRRRNATRVVVVHGRRRRNYGRRRRRNPGPTLFGHKAYGKQAATMIAGGLVGVAAAKLIPTLIPANLTPSQTGTTGVLIRTAITGASAIVASMIASKVMPGPFADGVLFGGLMQTGSTLLNAVLPGLKIAGVPVALSGMGEYMPALFSQPSNPLRGVPAPVPAQARVNMSGLGRAYGVAY